MFPGMSHRIFERLCNYLAGGGGGVGNYLGDLSVFYTVYVSEDPFAECVVPQNIHTPPRESCAGFHAPPLWKFLCFFLSYFLLQILPCETPPPPLGIFSIRR